MWKKFRMKSLCLLLLYTILLLINHRNSGAVSAQRIIITDSPNNQYVLVNGTAYFSCRYIGTNEIPLWLINGRSHVLLPSRHKYVNGILRVSSVKVSDNGTTYQCFFQEVSSGTGILYVVPTDAVRILKGPEDVSIEEGGDAEFPCLFTGTFSIIPQWKINGSLILVNQLPSGHSYSSHNQTLIVANVSTSLNSTTYQCVILQIESSIAILMVFPDREFEIEASQTSQLTREFELEDSQTFELRSYDFQPNEPKEDCNTTCSGRNIIGIGASVAAIFGIFLFLTACLLLTYKAWIFHSKDTCDNGSGNHENDVDMEENVCYESRQKNDIKVEKNVCYGNVQKDIELRENVRGHTDDLTVVYEVIQ